MSTHRSRRDDQSLTPAGLLDSLLGCDERTRRARSLVVTASTCAALLVLVVIIPLAIVFGASGAVGGGGLFAALAAVFAGKSFARWRRGGGAS